MPRFILTDIEGTTTDIDFVHKVLFPYAAEHLLAFVRNNLSQPPVSDCLAQVRQTLVEEGSVEASTELQPEMLIAVLLRWIKEDRKHTALKALQGMIWREGYEQGAYQAHMYPDVPAQLQQWANEGLSLGIYSSGSVEAQKLLFRYSIAGDLTGFFSDYFDTRVGAKREADAYARIANNLKLAPSDILFLSDIPEELDAAAQAGYQVIHVVRDDRTRPSSYPSVTSFSDIQLQNAGMIC